MTGSDQRPGGFPAAHLQWDESGQPLSARYDDVYFSRHNGLEETRYVFLQQNSLEERWKGTLPQRRFYIGETGFGSGLNFLAAWQLWKQSAPAERQLQFISVENEPLRKTDLEKALALWPELAHLSRELLAVYPALPTPGFHRFDFAGGRVALTLIIADAAEGLNQLLASDHPLHRRPVHRGMDAWFLDGFAPAKNPAMWRPELFDTIAALSAPQSTLATFTAAGLVRRELQRVGFAPEKRPGYGRKRHMLAARFAGQPPLPDSITTPCPAPWQVQSHLPHHWEVVIIGAGLAGSHTARALAERGWQVTVLDKAERIASGASGNAQGVVYGKLSRDTDGLAQFNLASLLYAQRLYRRYWRDHPGLGQPCGLLQLAYNEKEARIHRSLRESFSGMEDFLQFLDPPQASATAGVDIPYPALFFPQLGWLNPPLLCQRLLDHPNISLQCQRDVAMLDFDAARGHWQLLDRGGKSLAASPNVIIANAWEALEFSATGHLPLKAIRGQVSCFEQERIPLQTVLCSTGYIAPGDPARHQLQSFGATFTLHEQRPEVLPEDHRKNLRKLATSLPELTAALDNTEPEQLTGRTAFRCTTADYLPLVGPVPDYDRFVEVYRPLTKNAKARIDQAGPYLPGLYLNVGHGSRGLAYAPLSAALLAAQMDGDVLPVPRDLATALNPARFLIRNLIRNRLG